MDVAAASEAEPEPTPAAPAEPAGEGAQEAQKAAFGPKTVVFCKVPTMSVFPLITLNSRINGTRIMPMEDKRASWC